jgi:aminoglycoside 6'-N-acetyltransferase
VLAPVVEAHVADLRRIRRSPDISRRWGAEDEAPGCPFDDPTATLFSVMVDGVVRGMIQYSEENTPGYRHAGIDIFIDPEIQGRGIGRDAVRTLARHLVRDRGHRRLTIDPAVDNAPAIRCYAAVGFCPVGVMRRYERDADGHGCHDALLMDLLAEELA